MRNLQHSYFWSLLLSYRFLLSLSFSRCFAAWDAAGVKADDFAPGQLEAHYLKHGDQFGQITQEQYLQGRRRFWMPPQGGYFRKDQV